MLLLSPVTVTRKSPVLWRLYVSGFAFQIHYLNGSIQRTCGCNPCCSHCWKKLLSRTSSYVIFTAGHQRSEQAGHEAKAGEAGATLGRDVLLKGVAMHRKCFLFCEGRCVEGLRRLSLRKHQSGHKRRKVMRGRQNFHCMYAV